MKNLLFGILSLISSGLVAQVTLDKTSHNFGDIYKGDARLAEFNLMNQSSKSIFILRADQDREVDIKFSSKTVASGTYATIRIQYNPRSKGKFKKDINLYISSLMEPFVLELKGNVKELEATYLPCPSFTHPDKIQPIQFSMTAYITDIKTGAPLENASIQMLRNGIPLEEPLITNDQGKVLPRRLTGTSLKYQRKVSLAVKKARQIALLPYVADGLK
ncbi:MAG: 30S ribosomal protein S18 [Bacteroidetes bacterium]|nr:MAG: 30S ribosomal protein S18 [Bacteroidota bacterium]